jgi:hypothetical protein
MLNVVSARRSALVACVVACCGGAAQADVVFSNVGNNGYFTPFSATSSSSLRYGDSGWLSNFQPEGYTLTSITLGLVMFGSTGVGSTDISFTLNDGDPSGLVFGSGATLYSTTITNVVLPDASENFDNFATFSLTIPLPNVQTSGGFNNVGFSIGVSNYASNGQMGFQCSSAFGQTVGFYTNNASSFNGTSWSLFSFGSNPVTGVANFVATIEGTLVPSPAGLAIVPMGALLMRRRRAR